MVHEKWAQAFTLCVIPLRRRIVRKSQSLLMQVLMLLAFALPIASAQSGWQVLRTFHIGGEGGWDYVTGDAPNPRLFGTRSAHTLAIDASTGKVLGDIQGQKGSHGVAI